MKQVAVKVYELEGYAITVNVEGDVKEYAESFLHIFNNVRESKELLRVENHYGSNDVTVYCELEVKENLIKYLKMFGKIVECEKVLMYQMEEPEYDFEKYNNAVVVPDFE